MFKNKKRGFTLIELLVVIAIIGILATLAVVALQQARQSARDSKRMADMKQLHTSLELFFNENSRYPSLEEWESGSITSSIHDDVFMYKIPSAPTPADGVCLNSDYQYIPSSDGSSYQISFCTGKKIADLNEGVKCLTPGGMVEGDCSFNGVLPCSASTPANSVCSYGGQEYHTIQVGAQIWFKENLNVGTRVDKSMLSENDLYNDILEKVCYDDLESNCSLYGGLYSLNEAVDLSFNVNCITENYLNSGDFFCYDSCYCPYGDDEVCNGMGFDSFICNSQIYSPENRRGVCPSGWRLPNDEDWSILENYLKDEEQVCNSERFNSYECISAGQKLKVGGSSEMDVQLGGIFAMNAFRLLGERVNLASATPFVSTTENYIFSMGFSYRVLSSHSDGLSRSGSISGGSSPALVAVRCIKN